MAVSLCAPLRAQCGAEWSSFVGLPGTSDFLSALTSWDPDGPGPATPVVVAVGRFDVAGSVPANNIASFDPATGRVSMFGRGLGGPTHPTLTRGAYSLATLANGDLVVGGNFSFSGPTSLNYIGRWDGTSWHPLGSGMDGPVTALCVAPNGDLIAGGYFTTAGGVQASRVARWDGTAWYPLGAGTDDAVRALTMMPNGDVVAGGYFQSAGGTAANLIARWDGSAWHPLGSGLSVSPGRTVLALAVLPNGDLVVGGWFDMAGTTITKNLARWNGSSWSAFGAGTNVTVFAMTMRSNGDLVIGGSFNSVNGVPANGVARWDGSTWSALGNGLNYYVLGLTELPTGELFAGGDFRSSGPTTLLNLARWDGIEWSPPTGKIDGTLTSLTARAAGGLIVGGTFDSVAGVSAPRIAVWDGSSWSGLGSGNPADWDGAVNAIAEFANGDVLAGGAFTRVGGVAANHVARWDGVAWQPLGPGVSGPPGGEVSACVVHSSGDVYVGGTISNGIARWDGAAWHDVGLPTAGSNTSLSALLELPNGEVVAGGLFTTIGGTTAANIARWDGSSWHPLAAGTAGRVRALTCLPNGDLVAAGDFTIVNGTTSANRIARWDGIAWSPLGSGFNGRMFALEVLPSGDLIAGGYFTIAGSGPVFTLARWDGTAWSAIVNAADSVVALALRRDGALAFAGAMGTNTVSGVLLGEWRSTCPGTAVPIPTACTGSTGPLTLSASSLPWVGSTFESAAAGFAPGALGASVVGLSSPNVPLSVWTPFAGPGCSQLASIEALDLVMPQAGTASDTVTIPNSPAHIGLVLFHQFLQLEPGGPLQPPLVSSSNGLRLTVGAF
ncbi:MAG: hypothetical protein KDE27_14970 [Planctomycetes bacterium]|nr:hypothetical protein [Planctomycetota bacterium]